MLRCIVLLILISSVLILPVKSYFEVILDYIETISENSDIWEWHLKVRKINKTRSVIGYAEFKVPIGNDYKVQLKILKKQGGEYRYLPYGVQPTPFCDFVGDDTLVYPDIAKNSNMPADIKNDCPLKPGNYSLNGIVFSLENVPKVILSSGDYATEMIFINPNNEVIAVYRVFASINNI